MSDSAREKAWDERILEQMSSGVDPTFVRENLRLTPTERVEKVTRVEPLATEDLDIGRGRSRPSVRRFAASRRTSCPCSMAPH